MPPTSRAGNWYTSLARTRAPESRSANTLRTLCSQNLVMDTPGRVRPVAGTTASCLGSVCRVWFFQVRDVGSDRFWHWESTSASCVLATAMAI